MNVFPLYILLLAVASHHTMITGDGCTGTIHGVVKNQLGQPVGGLVVTLDPLGVDLGYVLPTARTDGEGRYQFDQVCPGRYALLLSQDGTGEQDTQASILFHLEHDLHEPDVVISNRHPAVAFDVHLAPPPGILLIRVRDHETASDIRTAEIRMHIPGKPKSLWVGIIGNREEKEPIYRVHVPADRDVQVRVVCDGYKEWRNGKSRGKVVRLTSGVTLNLNVELQPRRK